MKCNKCGTTISDDMAFCSGCGASVSSNSSADCEKSNDADGASRKMTYTFDQCFTGCLVSSLALIVIIIILGRYTVHRMSESRRIESYGLCASKLVEVKSSLDRTILLRGTINSSNLYASGICDYMMLYLKSPYSASKCKDRIYRHVVGENGCLDFNITMLGNNKYEVTGFTSDSLMYGKDRSACKICFTETTVKQVLQPYYDSTDANIKYNKYYRFDEEEVSSYLRECRKNGYVKCKH